LFWELLLPLVAQFKKTSLRRALRNARRSARLVLKPRKRLRPAKTDLDLEASSLARFSERRKARQLKSSPRLPLKRHQRSRARLPLPLKLLVSSEYPYDFHSY
jgi:hypothetical protein